MFPYPAYSQYAQHILDQYEFYRPEFLTVTIGFDGTASQPRLNRDYSPLPDDFLLLDIRSDFDNQNVLVSVRDTNGVYWSEVEFSIAMLAANINTAIPVLPLPIEYFVAAQNKLLFNFTNSASSPTTGGTLTLRGIRLLKKKGQS